MKIPNYLIHYYKNRDFLFKTISELDEIELNSALDTISDKSNISFTVDDSMWSFGFDFFRKGIIDWNPEEQMKEQKFHGKLFHINELEEVINNYSLKEGQNFEIQIWDKSILEEFISNECNDRII